MAKGHALGHEGGPRTKKGAECAESESNEAEHRERIRSECGPPRRSSGQTEVQRVEGPTARPGRPYGVLARHRHQVNRFRAPSSSEETGSAVGPPHEPGSQGRRRRFNSFSVWNAFQKNRLRAPLHEELPSGTPAEQIANFPRERAPSRLRRPLRRHIQSRLDTLLGPGILHLGARKCQKAPARGMREPRTAEAPMPPLGHRTGFWRGTGRSR